MIPWPDSSGTADWLGNPVGGTTIFVTTDSTYGDSYCWPIASASDNVPAVDWELDCAPRHWGPVAWGWRCRMRFERGQALVPRMTKLPPCLHSRPQSRPQLYHSESKRRRMHRAGVSSALQRRRR